MMYNYEASLDYKHKILNFFHILRNKWENTQKIGTTVYLERTELIK